MEFVPMKSEHALLLKDLLGVHAEAQITEEIAKNVETSGDARTAIADDGTILGIAGISEKWEGTGVAWAWLSRKWKRHARAITKEIQANIKKSSFSRIELAVREEFDAGHRWARLLGFVLETPIARRYGPDGHNYSIYVRFT